MDVRGALRERGRWTRAAIVSVATECPGISRSAVAKRLGVTVQAVSVQAQELVESGLLADDGGLRPTPEGIAALQADSAALQAAAKQLAGPLAEMDVISAVAARRIPAGRRVGLWMRSGDLVADPDEVGPCHGTASNDAEAGDEVRVRAPQGITPFTPGTIELLVVPDAKDGGIDAVDTARIQPWDGLVAAVGTGASILARQHGALDLPYAGAEAAKNAAQRGQSVRVYVAASLASDAMDALAGLDVRIQDAPRKKG